MIAKSIINYGIHYFVNNSLDLFNRVVVWCGTKCQQRVNFIISQASVVPLECREMAKDKIEAIREVYNRKLTEDEVEKIRASFYNFQVAIEEESMEQAISAERFDEIVKMFKQFFEIKSSRKMFSRSCFSNGNWNDDSLKMSKELEVLLSDIFFACPILSGYLVREFVESRGNELVLKSKYERSLYKGRPETSGLIPFRTIFDTLNKKAEGDLGEPSKAFYLRGTPPDACKRHFDIEKFKIRHILSEKIDFSLSGDIYCVRDNVSKISKSLVPLSDVGFKYCVWSGRKDEHAYLTIAILDMEVGTVVCTLLMNSWKSGEYYEYLRCRFQQYDETIPFVDCSIDIQVGKDDTNCELYAASIGRGFIQLCHEESNEMSQVVKKYQESKEAKEIQGFVGDRIVRYLPEYFYKDGDGAFQRKSVEELRDFHMQRRWDIGNQFIRERSEEAKGRLKDQGII